MNPPIDYAAIIQQITHELSAIQNTGKVASYIPELGRVNPAKLGIHITSVEGQNFSVGDASEKFSIQSISKILSLTLALELAGFGVWERVGIEPSGTAFNSLIQLELEKGIPRNPCINAGAIVVCDILVSHLQNPKVQILDFIRGITGLKTLDYSQAVAASETQHAYRNLALANLMKDFGNIHNDVHTVLDVYFHLCAIEMTCQELAQTFLCFAANGTNPLNNKKITTVQRAKRINAIMQMCGFYDEAGEFAFKVGLPGKSGVGGGIVAVHPGRYSVAVWSPKLNAKGNSFMGMKVLEALTTKTQLSIF